MSKKKSVNVVESRSQERRQPHGVTALGFRRHGRDTGRRVGETSRAEKAISTKTHPKLPTG